jgi:hypothetical protein
VTSGRHLSSEIFGAPEAITTTVHRLFCFVYLSNAEIWSRIRGSGMQFYKERFRQQQIGLLKKNTARLGFQVSEL